MRLMYFSSSVNSFFKRAHAQPSSGATCLIYVGPFIYFHISCVRTANVLARLRGCAGSPKPSLVANVISTIISCAGSNISKNVSHRQLANCVFIDYECKQCRNQGSFYSNSNYFTYLLFSSYIFNFLRSFHIMVIFICVC